MDSGYNGITGYFPPATDHSRFGNATKKGGKMNMTNLEIARKELEKSAIKKNDSF